jgi:hypothetical protein
MVECFDCNKEFEKEDTIYVCGVCDEPLCEDCKAEHDCIEEPETESNIICDKCGNCTEEMSSCPVCDDYFCEDCITEHIKEEKESIEFEEYEFGEYAKEKIAENL